MKDKVGIVLVNYNGEKFQNECIRSIKEMEYTNYEIILVDNGSRDKSVELVKKEFDDIHIIETGENCGVAKGNNIGIKKSMELGCEYILLLNNDTEVDKFMLTHMMKKASKEVMVTCKMYYFSPNNVIWCAGGKINWKDALTEHFGEGEIDKGQCDESKFVEYTPTCCLLIHKSIFESVGIMDENYFMYYDDTDFVVRANSKGYKIWYESSAKLWHKVSSSSGGAVSKISTYFLIRNRLYFINKFYNNKFKITITYYFAVLKKLAKYILVNRELAPIVIKAVSDCKNNRMFWQNI